MPVMLRLTLGRLSWHWGRGARHSAWGTGRARVCEGCTAAPLGTSHNCDHNYIPLRDAVTSYDLRIVFDLQQALCGCKWGEMSGE